MIMSNLNITIVSFCTTRYLRNGLQLAIIIVASAILFSCQAKKGNKINQPKDSWKTFENEYFSIKYPSDYVVVGEFPVGADNLQTASSDTTLATATNEIDIMPCNPTKDKPWLHIVLSRYKIQLSLRDFMQASMAFKGMGKEEVYTFSDVDSTSLAGLPALAVTFGYPQESGDTIVQRQTIVQLPDYKLYYINLNCSSGIVNNSDKLAPVFKMLETMKFK
jgi:hypothetical protein